MCQHYNQFFPHHYHKIKCHEHAQMYSILNKKRVTCYFNWSEFLLFQYWKLHCCIPKHNFLNLLHPSMERTLVYPVANDVSTVTRMENFASLKLFISKFIWHPNEHCNKENQWACYNNELSSCIKSKNKQLETSTYFMLLVRTIYLCCTKSEDWEMNYGLKFEIAN